jgi:hypothetical protein
LAEGFPTTVSVKAVRVSPKERVMPLVFVIPGPQREFVGNREQIRVKGRADSLSAALSLLWAQCPGLRDRADADKPSHFLEAAVLQCVACCQR